MSATIHYIRDHYRGRNSGTPARTISQPKTRPSTGSNTRSGIAFVVGMLLFIVALAILGVWLTDGVASIGRANGECLTSARRVCGIFPSEHALNDESVFPHG